ncbi:CLN_G0056280.mRNA.1.CDS.1 [Saccharomyces cerevisiae]|nr:CLN_G0056280.mRNA.1.CDS.1 [Saccharomyces cerevisiae]CAI7485958.1 CLN_G0056280.mRNA.1.CDS.1 [Saccharomyces cerevisiae]
MTLNNVARPDLCVSYKKIAPPKGLYPATPSISGVVNQSMPMAAIFLRNKFIAWFSLIQSVHYYLNTDEDIIVAYKENKAPSPMDQPPAIKLFMSLIGLCVCYMNLVFPQQIAQPSSSGSKGNTETTIETTTEVETETAKQ